MKEFQTSVGGIPCICRVEYYTPVIPSSWDGPAEGGDFDFTLRGLDGKPDPQLDELQLQLQQQEPGITDRLFHEFEKLLREEKTQQIIEQRLDR